MSNGCRIGKYYLCRFCKNPCVKRERRVVNIVSIQFNLPRIGKTRRPTDLRQTRNARLGQCHDHMLRLVSHNLLRLMRARTDKGHFPFQYVDKLRKLIYTELPQHSSNARHPRVTPYLKKRSVAALIQMRKRRLQGMCIAYHRSEFIYRDDFPAADPGKTDDHRSGCIKFYGKGNKRKKRCHE